MYGAQSEKKSYCDFMIKKEHQFLQNNFSNQELKSSQSICDLERFFSTHLRLKDNKESLMEDVNDEEILSFMHKSEHSNFETLFEEISEMKVKNFYNS